ncbi:MAG: tetratricopeptide repeat protein, partial [Candidatus Omnitrophica bacterium]|nr:tetratricopeptide repeat protein [Candidatus Omnitrophota bacterium]
GGLKSISEYLRLFILPRGLHLDYGFPRISFFSGGAILGLLAALFLLYYIFRSGRKRKELFFGILWFIIFFIPVSSIYPLNAYMAENWMYLPSAGVFTALAWLFTRLIRRGGFFRPAGWAVLIAFLGFFSYVSISQNKKYWKDDVTLYRRTLELAPRSFKARGNLAGIYLEKGLYAKAESEYKKTIETKPDFASAYEGLGLVYFKKGDYSEAVKHLKQAVRLKPNCLSAYNNLGNAYFRSFMYNEAEESYEKALEIDSGYVKAINNLALIYYDRGWKEKAKRLWLDALRIDPDYKPALSNLKIFFGNGSFKGD